MSLTDLPDDVTRSILYLLDDTDLARTCLTNKNFSKKICNNTFWLNKILNKYPLTAEEIKEFSKGKTYWAYYFDLNRIIEDIDKNIELNKKYFDAHDHAWHGSQQTSRIYSAANTGRLDIFKIFLRLGKAPERIRRKYREGDQKFFDNYLVSSSRKGHIELVKWLLEIGADPHYDFDEPLRLASRAGNLDIIKLLLEYGANPHSFGDQIIDEARRARKWDVLELLTGEKHKKCEIC